MFRLILTAVFVIGYVFFQKQAQKQRKLLSRRKEVLLRRLRREEYQRE